MLQSRQCCAQLRTRRPLAVAVVLHVASYAAVRCQRGHRRHLVGGTAVGQLKRHVGIVVGGVGKVGAQSAITPTLIFSLVGIAVAAHPVRGKLPVAHHLCHRQSHAPHRGAPSETCHRAVGGHHAVVGSHAIISVAILRPFRHQHRRHSVGRVVFAFLRLTGIRLLQLIQRGAAQLVYLVVVPLQASTGRVRLSVLAITNPPPSML